MQFSLLRKQSAQDSNEKSFSIARKIQLAPN